MKIHFVPALLGLALLAAPVGRAADDTTAPTDKTSAAAAEDATVAKEINDVIASANERVQENKQDEKDYEDLLNKLGEIAEKHKALQSDHVAVAVVRRAQILLQVTTNADRFDKAIAIIEQGGKDFPQTQLGQHAAEMVQSVHQAVAADKRMAESKKIQAALVTGADFPDFSETDFDGKPVSVAAHKGKLVLVDFWATWCGPCRAEFPNVKKTYETYHDKGFDIVGVSLDKDKGALAAFIKDNGITWPQYFDGLYWSNKLALKYGIESIPATILVDGNGKILARDLRGDALTETVAKALAAK